MFGRNRKAQSPPAPEEMPALTRSLERNVKIIDEMFTDVDVLIRRFIRNDHSPDLAFALYCCDGVVNSMMINDSIVRPLQMAQMEPGRHLLDDLESRVLQVNEIARTADMGKIETSLTYGDVLLLVDGFDEAIILSSKFLLSRSVSEPESELILSGPRDGFVDTLMMNLSLLRRRLRTRHFKVKFQELGRQTHTQVAICYLDSTVNRKYLRAIQERISHIDIDGVLDVNYISEYIVPPSILGFNLSAPTERPDVICAKLLEGRIALLVDGSPVALTLPHLFIESFQSNEDYYVNPTYASFSRMLRILGFILTIAVPGLYVAIVTHHHEILPSALLIHIASERARVPLPAAAECFAMLLTFDILRETGIRMPKGIGTALSIVGALVIGQSAVSANLVAAPMIIVVGFTGITNLLVPRMSAPALLLRYGLLALASMFGLAGFVAGMVVAFTHVMNLQSLDMPELLPIDRPTVQRLKDIIIRAPWPRMQERIAPLSHNRTRAGDHTPGSVDGGDDA